ncbi:MAG: hypothetical protein M0Q38_04515 [Bacteroidales bacterium]|jgi:hypothetical protein|nr:hypothetical protein [Bacteroidales bacterium]
MDKSYLGYKCTAHYNYVVIIQLLKVKSARFISAYEMNEPDNLKKILESPKWNFNDLDERG